LSGRSMSSDCWPFLMDTRAEVLSRLGWPAILGKERRSGPRLQAAARAETVRVLRCAVAG
jgi:hypothetical protein